MALPQPNPDIPVEEEEAARIAETAEVFNKAEKILKAMQTPQSIRELQPFDGNPVKLHSFIRAVENLLPFLEPLIGTPFEKVWLQSIRAKIIGDADQVLEIYGTPTVWAEIKSNLIAYYNDKRDAVTLTRELFQRQQHGTIEDFYGEVQQLLSLLINHANITTEHVALRADRIQTHQENALQVFLAGLKEPIGGNVRARKPSKLKEAFDAAIEERNFQNRFGLNKMDFTTRIQKQAPPPPPPQKQRSFNNPFSNQRPQFQPQPNNFRPFQQNQGQNSYQQYPPRQGQNPYQYPPRNFNTQANNTPQVPPRNAFAPRPVQLPKPVPMEVDPSIRSNKINYMNRPQRSIHYHEGSYPQDTYETSGEQNGDPYQENYVEQFNGENPTFSEADNTQQEVEQNESADELNFQFITEQRPPR